MGQGIGWCPGGCVGRSIGRCMSDSVCGSESGRICSG